MQSKPSRLLILVAVALAAVSVISVLPQVSAVPTVPQGSETGSASPTPYKYRWVDSTATGCKAPSLIGSGVPPAGSPLLPKTGCPMGWDEIAGGCVHYTGYTTDYAYPDYCAYGYLTSCSCWNYPTFQYYGSTWYSYSWYVSENGFINFGCNAGPVQGIGTRTAQQMPSTPIGTNCGTATAAQRPAGLAAGYWTNMQANYYGYIGASYVGYAGCWDNPSTSWLRGAIWESQPMGTAPLDYVVIEYDHVLVNAADTGCNASPTPNKYATFEFKLWLSQGSIDVIYKPGSYPSGGVDNNAQQVSLGVENYAGTAGLDYCFAACGPTAGSASMSDRAVRYYPNHMPIASSKTITINEDCTAPLTCVNTAPNMYGYDPDYPDAGTETFSVSTPPATAHGTMLGSCTSGSCTYQPFLNYNGGASITYSVTDADGSSSGTLTFVISPLNDKPTAADRTYNVGTGDWLYVSPPAGVIQYVTSPALAARDPEVVPDRDSWGTATPCPSPPGAAGCGLMTEGGPAQHLEAMLATASCGWAGSAGPSPAGMGSLTGFATDGSFTYTAPSSSGLVSYKFCIKDVLDSSGAVISYSPYYTIYFNVAAPSGLVANSDLLPVPEDTTLAAVGALAPKSNDIVTGSGVSFAIIPGSGPNPANYASFSWPGDGTFSYTPKADWSGTDGFFYQFTSSAGTSNTASVKIVVTPINDQPKFTTWKAGGDTIQEDGGCVGVCAPYVRSVPSFITGIGPGGGADELTQTLRAVILSQSNPAILKSTVPYPGNYDFSVLAAPSPPLPGPAITISGSAGSQIATLTYTTVPDANGVDTVCFRLMDNGGVTGGGIDKNPNPPADPLCFDIVINAVDDAPRPQNDKYTMYKNHNLFAPAAATTFPFVAAAVPSLFGDNGFGPDVEVDGQSFKSYMYTLPAKGKLEGNAIGVDGSFHYTPNTDYVGTDTFKYRIQDQGGTWSQPATVTIVVLTNVGPTASFTASSYAGVTGAVTDFVGVCSDPDGTIKAWLWDFGDGSQSTETSPSHSYAQAGTYTVTLKCIDDKGDVATVSKVIEVGWGNDRPAVEDLSDLYGSLLVAYAGENQNVPEGAKVALHGVANGGKTNAPIGYSWTQASGTPVTLAGAATADPTFLAPSFKGSAPASVVLSLIVTDGKSTSLPSLVQVTVHSTNQQPVADAGADQELEQGTVGTLDGSASSDPDKDTLAFTWTQLAGHPVALSDVHAVKPTFEVPAYDGTQLLFQLVVDDGDARSSSIGRVMALPPAAAAAGFTYEAVRTDAGILVTFHSNVPGKTFIWEFGDQTSSTEASPTHTYGKPGTYVVRMSVASDAEPQAWERPITLGDIAARNANPVVERTSPGAGILEVLVLAGCAALLARRR